MNNKVAILDFVRTPVGKFQGQLKDLSAVDLASQCLTALTTRTPYTYQAKSCYLGNVLPAGLGQHPAKLVAKKAMPNHHLDCLNINKVCGSGMMSLALAYERLLNDSNQIIIAGGVESMSRTPYLISRNIKPNRLGPPTTVDHLLHDGLTSCEQLMVEIAESKTQGFNRKTQDDYVINTYQRHLQHKNHPLITDSIIALQHKHDLINTDEIPEKFCADKLRTLTPVLGPTGTITAGNASQLADGAALCLLAGQGANVANQDVKAWLLGYSLACVEPIEFMLAPSYAIQSLLKQLEWTMNDVALFEINEAFAITALLNIDQLNLNLDQVNILGGACVLGHPLGMSGTRIVGQLYHALKIAKQSKGIASICIGGGEAIAIALEVEQ